MDRSRAVIILAATAVLVAPYAPVLAEVPAEYRNPATANDYPDADVLALQDVQTFTLHPDGRIDRRVFLVQKVLTYHGMDEIGDPHFAFDSAHQTLEVVTSRTYTPEGEVRDTQANGINEITPFALEKAPDDTDIRQMVVTHVGLDIGATVVTEVLIRDTSPWRSFLEAVIPLQNDEPALVRQVVVRLPTGTPFQHLLVQGEADFSVTQEGDEEVYTWTLKQVPVAKLAFAEPEARTFLPTLLFTTAPSWTAWTDKLSARLSTALEDPDGRVMKQANHLLEGKDDTLARIDALQDFVVHGVLTAHWPLEAFDYTIRTASRTLASRHGHPLDKAVLLAALLTASGFETDVVLLGPNPSDSQELRALPCLARLDTALVRVQTRGVGILWLDPTSSLREVSVRDFLGWDALIVRRDAEGLSPVRLPAGPSRMAIRLEATLKEDLSLEGAGDITLLGYYAPFHEIRGDTKRLEAFVSSLLGSVVDKADTLEVAVATLEPFQIRLHVTFSAKAPEKTPRVLTLETGIPSGSLLGASPLIYLDQRTLPLALPAAGEETVTVVWRLPEGKTPRFLPKPVRVTGQIGRATRTWRLEDNTLTMTAMTTLQERVVSVDAYPTFKRMHDAMAAQASCVVVF